MPARTFDEYRCRWTPDYERRVRQEASRIQSDGCSGVADFFLIVCEEHDIHYATHRDFIDGSEIEQCHADNYLRWGIQLRSWFGRWSPMAWWRYKGLHALHFGDAAWRSGPARLAAKGIIPYWEWVRTTEARAPRARRPDGTMEAET